MPQGSYSYGYHTTHPDDALNSPFGSYGNWVFNVPGCIGCGVHSGRANSRSVRRQLRHKRLHTHDGPSHGPYQRADRRRRSLDRTHCHQRPNTDKFTALRPLAAWGPKPYPGRAMISTYRRKPRAPIALITLAPMLLLLVTSEAVATQCSRADAQKAEYGSSTLHTWEQVFRSYRLYPGCDDGAISEGYSNSVATLLASKWKQLPDLMKLIKMDPPLRCSCCGTSTTP
jgi:hypothetical protein